MAEEAVTAEVTTEEVPLDQITDMREFKKAREEGKETITKEAAPKEEAESTEEKEKPRVRGGFQAKIDRLVKAQAALEEQLAAERREKEELKSKQSGKTEDKPAIDPEAEPRREHFDTEAAYIRALTRWEVKQELKQERETEEREAQAAVAKESITNYNNRAIEAQSRYDDWKETMSQDINLPTIVGEAIVHTIKNGPDVAYYLGKHPEVCQEMLSVHPLEAVGMAVKISEQIEKEFAKDEEEVIEEKAAEPEKPAKKAPAPIRPISGGASRSTVSLDKVSFSEYKKLRSQGRMQ